MINVVTLQNRIISNPEYIVTILEALGYSNIKDKQKYYSFPHKDGDNAFAISILKNTLQYTDFSHGGHGNIFTFVMQDKNINFREALSWINEVIGGGEEDTYYKVRLPFGGFYKDLLPSNEEVTLKTYPEDVLPKQEGLSLAWLSDGVSLIEQERWGLRLDFTNNGLIIPWYDLSGNLIGAKSRSNDPDVPMDKRWYAYLPFPKSQCCYGLFQNYKHIVEKRKLIIVEAEKSVLQAVSFGCNICIAIGGHDISAAQANIIKSMMCSEIIVAFDEGVSDDESRYNAKKLLSNNSIIKTKVGFIKDDEGNVRIMGGKESPTDNGKEAFRELLRGYIEWI